MNIQKNYYAIIPANVRYDKDLKPNAKLLYGEITALANEKGYCWANNNYFADLYDVSKFTISRWVTQLEEKGYIATFIQYKNGTKQIQERRIYIGTYCQKEQEPIDENDNTYCQKEQGPIAKKSKDNNTFNTTVNNTLNNNIVEQSPTSQKIMVYKEIIDYLNQCAGTNYRHTSKATQRLIDARLKEGFTVDDFKVVIYKKCLDWKGNPKWETYLRTSTLFGSKFEIYLNQKEKQMTTAHMSVDHNFMDDAF